MTPAASATILALSLDAIVESPDNPRKHFDPAFLAELAESMRISGQFTPCIVRPHPKLTGKYELAAGATRLRAARTARLERLDCLIKQLDDAQFLELLTFENLKRRDLHPMEEARGYAVLQKRLEGWTVEKIASRSGVSVDYVRDRLRLLKLIPSAAALLESHKIQLAHALELAKLNAEQQKEMLDSDVWEGGMWRSSENDLPDLDDKKDKYAGQFVVSPRELKAAIADRFAIDLEDASTPDLFPDLVAAVKKAEEKAMPVVFICDEYSAPVVEKGEAPILSRRQWRRADGTKGAKACKHATQLGVGRLGSVRGQSFTVCTAASECRTHFADEIANAEREAKWKADSAKSRATPKENSWEKSARLKKEAVKAMRPALPAIREALGVKIAIASVKPTGAIADLLLHEHKQLKPEAKKRFPSDLLRQMAYTEALAILGSEWQLDRFRKFAKAIGVDLTALIKAAQPKQGKAAKKKVKR